MVTPFIRQSQPQPLIRIGIPKGLRRRPHEAATIAKVREAVERTRLTYRQIARQTGTSAAFVSRQARAGGWLRPDQGFAIDHYSAEGRRLLRRRALAEVLMRQAERHVFETEMNPDARPKALERAFRLLRMAKAFDEIHTPKRKPRKRKARPTYGESRATK